MAEMIPRALIDLAISNLDRGISKDLGDLKSRINGAWAILTEARKTAKNNREALYDAADRKWKKDRGAEIAAYKGASGKPDAPSFEAHQQTLAAIDDVCTQAKSHADEVYNGDCAAAENGYRESSKDYISMLKKSVNITLGIFETAHP
jgi:hypothetical protein